MLVGGGIVVLPDRPILLHYICFRVPMLMFSLIEIASASAVLQQVDGNDRRPLQFRVR